ncbi:MAG TPA: hypothetical protein VHO72_02545 [Bacteroidales bacterium]|nr:hypothetical protein [Bacteroidales bacterium]
MMDTILRQQRTVMALLILAMSFIIFSCTSQHATTKLSTIPLSQNTLLEKPFEFEPTIKNFSKHIVPPYKLSIFTVQNRHQPSQKDTIYKFHRKKSELFIFKSRSNREMLFAGNICDDKISLLNGVKVGINRAAFFNSFTDVKYNQDDTVKMTSKAKMMNYKFVFKNDKLVAIKFDAYID